MKKVWIRLPKGTMEIIEKKFSIGERTHSEILGDIIMNYLHEKGFMDKKKIAC